MTSYLIKRNEIAEIRTRKTKEEILTEKLSRLVHLQGSDAGFFLLATHSFIESTLRDRFQLYGDDYRFPDLLYKFRMEIVNNAKGFIRELKVLGELSKKQIIANEVRHRFGSIDQEEAVAATYRLLMFCQLAGIDNYKELPVLEESLKIWEDRKCNWERMKELSFIGLQLSQSQKRNKEILDEVDELKSNQIQADHVHNQIESLNNQLEQEKSIKVKKDSRIKELRQKKHDLECEKKKKDTRIIELEDAKVYLQNLSRLSNYTRTRFDYEQNITRLTKEQQRVLDIISLKDDFLIKGGAGTGKTLVLIKALEIALSLKGTELDFDGESVEIKLLTYNKTLAKYDKYLAMVMDHEDEARMISTVDKFLYDKMRTINENYRIVYNSYAEKLASEYNTTSFFSNQEVVNEIEGYLFANNITRQEYIDQLIPRKGLKKPLNLNQREEIWDIRATFIEDMVATESFTKNYSRAVILEYIKNNPEDSSFKSLDFVFIDEVQDLSAVDIQVLKACSKRAVIMAGDADQSIYQPSFTFARAGVDIRGTTRILRTNFRNTMEIHGLAESYREKSDKIDLDTQPEAFRTGPVPELYAGVDKQELLSMIVKRVKLFTQDLNYDPENICILVPTSDDVGLMQEVLTGAGYDSYDLRKDDFSFDEENIIRISTLHSSKGLDFPIVLLFLYRLPFTGNIFDDESRGKMKRNLIYVSLTRAMDHVNVFVLDGESKVEIRDLIEVFDETTG
ncbi:MAG: AAA family ATPase [Spirochaetia bacterium]|nr:AAA family ATPase [Spirochaetia bacterium]